MLWLASVVLVAVGLVALTAAMYGLAWVLFLHGDVVAAVLAYGILLAGVVFIVVAVHEHLKDRS